MTKILMFQTVIVIEIMSSVLFLTFGNLILEFVSIFDIRYSNFEFRNIIFWGNNVLQNRILSALPNSNYSSPPIIPDGN